MSELIPFHFDGAEVRTVTIDGEPGFIAADVAKILGFQDAYYLTRGLDDDEKVPHIVGTPGGDQEMTVITEAGLYSAILRSRVPEAKPFKRWVTHEVLPAIRKTGSYGTPSIPDITTAAGVAQMAQMFADTANKLVASEAMVAELAPAAEVGNRLLNAEGDLSVADAAKALTRAGVKVGATRLFTVLAGMKWIYRGGDSRWRTNQRAIESGHMSVLPSSHYHPRTGVLVLDPPQVRVTPKGLQKLLADHGVEVYLADEFSAPIGVSA